MANYDLGMRVWVEIPGDWGWGPVQALRGRLAKDGYWTERITGTGSDMIIVTGSRPDPNTLATLLPP
jgi:hypothetical protein